MTEALAETAAGSIAAFDSGLLERKTLVALGPGLGTHPETAAAARRLAAECELPLVIDADGLNALAGSGFRGSGRVRVLTPHPGEMSRLTGRPVEEIQEDRVDAARRLAAERAVTVVLKGQRTIIAYPDGKAWINPSGTPALAKGGTGDVLTGLVAGMMAQFPQQWELAVRAAVWLHGRAGELAARERGEQGVLAADLFAHLAAAIRETA
jgi:NAD(P)H-hydrate epimerase